MIVFVPAIFTHYEEHGYTLKQYDSVAMPIYKELQKNGADVKWGTWDDEAEAYVCTNPYKFRGKTKKLIYCPDGLALQESVYPIFGGTLFPGPYWRQIFEEAYGKSHGKTDTEKDPCYPSIGWPPLDLWFSSERKEKEEQLREELKLPYEKTVLFAGLYDGMGGFASEYMKRTLNRFLDTWKNYDPVNIIYKGHVITTMDFKTNQIVPRWAPVAPQLMALPYGNFVDPIKAGNVFDYSLVSDVVVSAESGTSLTSFMAVGIPTIQLGMRWYTGIRSVPGEAYIGKPPNIIGYSHSVKKFRPVPQIFLPGLVSESENFPDIVHHALNHPNEHAKEKQAFLQKMLYKVDGKASKRAADAILKMKEFLK